jgi:hypothetical protein
MISKNVSVFLFAHQDDEVFAQVFLRQALQEGAVFCIFCTRAPDNEMAHRRRLESERGLKALGLSEKDIFFLGDELGIIDAHLPGSIGLLLQRMIELLVPLNVDAVYVPAWEGGHHDHDALAVAGFALQNYFQTTVALNQYSLYHGERTSGKFFQVLTPLSSQLGKAKKFGLTIKDSLAIIFSILYYPSQWKTWLGLAPVILFHVLFRRAVFLVPLARESLLCWPHQGALLYERYGRIERQEFLEVLSQSLHSAGFDALAAQLCQGLR